MGFAKKIKVGAVIHCGDWNNPISVDTVFNFNIPIYAVVGNADINPEIARRLKFCAEKFSDNSLKFELDNIKIGITHKPSDIQKYFSDSDLDIIFCGHLHSQNESEFNGVKVIRPGALEIGINFAVYDTVTKKIEFINDQI